MIIDFFSHAVTHSPRGSYSLLDKTSYRIAPKPARMLKFQRSQEIGTYTRPSNFPMLFGGCFVYGVGYRSSPAVMCAVEGWIRGWVYDSGNPF